MSENPLSQRRIVVTRSVQQADSLSKRIAEKGGIPIPFPVIRFVSLRGPELTAALKRLDSYDWLLFTSVNAVQFFFERGVTLPTPSRNLRLAATGSATAAALQEQGLTADFMPDTFTGEQLVAGLGDLRGRRVLLPRSRLGRPEIATMLREAGALLDEIPLYDTIPADPDPSLLASMANGIDAITFTSPSSVRNFVQLTRGLKKELLDGATIACIGPITAEQAQKLGFEVAVQPARYTIDDLVEALSRYFENCPRKKDDAR